MQRVFSPGMFPFLLSATMGFVSNLSFAQSQQLGTVGTNTFTPHTSVIELTVEAVGGGGAGGKVYNAGTFDEKEGGGGGGGAYIKSFVLVSGGSPYPVSVGAGGYNGTTGGSCGVAPANGEAHGGDSYFDAGVDARAQGGRTKTGDGEDAAPGAVGGTVAASNARDKTGTTGTGQKFAGGTGGAGDEGGVSLGADGNGGGGGGAAGSSAAGGNASGLTGGIRGTGNLLDGTTPGNGGNGSDNGGCGSVGSNYGGGGGGSDAQSGGSQQNGRAGAQGVVVITWSQIDNISLTSGCADSAVTIFGSNFVNVSSVTLSGVAVPFTVVSTTQINIIIPAGAGSGNIIVTTEYGRCQHFFTINAPPPPISITGNTTPCAGVSQTYTVSGVAGATGYTWTFPAGWAVTAGAGTVSVTVTPGPTGGTIGITADDACGSSQATTLAVTVGGSIPVQPSGISGNTVLCAGATQVFSVTNDPNAVSYAWTLPSGWSGSSGTNSITATAVPGTGTISVVAVNSCGTSTAQTLNVTVNDVPAQPSVISGASPVCVGATQTYSVNNDPAAVSYTWTLPGGWSGSSGSNSISATAGAAGGLITVTANNTCGASSAQQFAVNVVDVPGQPGVISGSPGVCEGSAISYSVANDPSATSYSWTFPSGWSGNGNTNTVTATAGNSGGTITVTANNACGTSVSQTLAVTVLPTPARPVISASPSATLCEGDPFTLATSGVPPGGTYAWSGPGGFSGSNATVSVASAATSQSGAYSLSVTVAGCVSPTGTLTVAINPKPATPAITANSPVCTDTTLSLSASGTASSYVWNGPGGWTYTGQNPEIVAVSESDSGLYTVFAVENGCSSSVGSLVVEVSPKPQLDFSYVAVCAGQLTFSGEISQDSSQYAYGWSFGDGADGTGLSAAHEYAEPGTYTVVWQAKDAVCTASVSQDVIITQVAANLDKIPDIFTPNGDATNDVVDFTELLGPCEDFEVVYINRWGQEVFRQSKGTVPFSGKNKSGSVLVDGVYYYVIKYGDNKSKGGSLTIVH